MVGILFSLVVNGAALWAADAIVDGITFQGETVQFVLVAAIFAVINTFLKPVVKLLTFPISIVTLGIFLLVINALMLLLLGWLSGQLGLGFTVDGFGAAFLGGLVTAVAGWAMAQFTGAFARSG